jgi:AcrR family transcriptional regulator
MATSAQHRPSTAARRKQIIQAALACFSELGFDRTTMDAIRTRSQASTGSIYHHFNSKEQLAAAVYLDGIVDYQTGFLAELRQHSEAREGILKMVDYHLRWVSKQPQWARYLFRMRHAEFMAEMEPAFKEKNHAFMEQVTAWFVPHIDRGILRRLPRELYVSILFGPCQDFARRCLSGKARSDVATASRALGEAAWRSLSHPETSEPQEEQ